MEAGDTVWLTVTGASRLHEMLQGAGIDAQRGMPRALLGNAAVYVDQGSIDAGFSIPALRLHVLGDREIYGQQARRVKLRAVKEGVPVTLSDLSVGDFVVHAVHGIGQYLGLRTETILGTTGDYLDLQYAGNDRMLVPVHQMHHGDEIQRRRRRRAASFTHGRRRLGARQEPRQRAARKDRRRPRRALRRA